MGRIRSEIDVNGRRLWTLFDSGARNSYIARDAVRAVDLKKLPKPRETAFGGRTHEVKEACLVLATVEGRPLEFLANVVDEVGVDEDGRPIDVLFGALAMQLWNIKLDLKNERLDFSHFTKDFVEY
jgi:hypothetical protein